jgi:DNA-binding response OmpR family regulator
MTMNQVLVVEDNADMRLLVRIVLSQLNVTVVEAPTLAEGRETLGAVRPDLVLLDVSLPDGDSDELLPLIPEGVPVILMTAYPSHGLEMWEQHPSVVRLLHKPFSFHELLGAVQETIGVP